jgi:hypothetical protein
MKFKTMMTIKAAVALGLAATLYYLLSGVLNPLGWGIAAVYLFFTVGFGYFLLPQKLAA